jgi:hypothetical protein
MHHLLPQFYMRKFANAREQVRVVQRDSGSEFTAKTTKVLAQRDYYTVASERAENDHGVIEGLYSKIEGIAAPVFERLCGDDFPLKPEDRSEFASFMALQATRGQYFRGLVQDTTDRLGRLVLRAAADAPPSYWEARHAEWEASREGPEPPPPLTDADREMLRDGTAFRIVPSREHAVGLGFTHLTEMTTMLEAMTWRLVRFRQPCLFTSEHPVTYWNRRSSPGLGSGLTHEVRLALRPPVSTSGRD